MMVWWGTAHGRVPTPIGPPQRYCVAAAPLKSGDGVAGRCIALPGPRPINVWPRRSAATAERHK
jgi:hypothetical protein